MTNNFLLRVTEEIKNGQEITIHKSGVGQIRENCIYAKSVDHIPKHLIEDGAVKLNENETITLFAIEGPATRQFPVYICWEEVSAENAGKVPGKYGCWSKDNGDTTLKVVDGKCYNLPVGLRASLLTEEIPEWVSEAGFPVERKGQTWELNRTDWGEVRRGTIGKAFWVEHRKGKVNILALSEKSAEEYIVAVSGKDVGKLTELACL